MSAVNHTSALVGAVCDPAVDAHAHTTSQTEPDEARRSSTPREKGALSAERLEASGRLQALLFVSGVRNERLPSGALVSELRLGVCARCGASSSGRGPWHTAMPLWIAPAIFRTCAMRTSGSGAASPRGVALARGRRHPPWALPLYRGSALPRRGRASRRALSREPSRASRAVPERTSC